MDESDPQLFALHRGDVVDAYPDWPSPAAIISDGAYGIEGDTAGDRLDGQALRHWYRDHITAWSAAAQPETTLWVWNTEIGFALVHSEFARQGWEYVQTIVWDKGPRGEVAWPGAAFPVVTEICTLYRRQRSTPDGGTQTHLQDHPPAGHPLANVWSCPLLTDGERFHGSAHGNATEVTHPHQKPLKLMKRIIEVATRPGDVVWEPFAGAGTVSVAAIELGRRPFAAEINPRFADLTHQRLQAHTVL